MDDLKDNAPVTMIRGDLNHIPQFDIPSGYSCRWFQSGDEKIWQDIQSKADQYNTITDELFGREFGADVDLLQNRQGYLLDSHQRAIATATAWFDEDYQSEEYGRIHWVAIIPEQQGRGLAKPLMSLICNRRKELGHQRAYLTTSAARIAAISLYLKFGFKPVIGGDQENKIWEEIRKGIRKYKGGKRSNDV